MSTASKDPQLSSPLRLKNLSPEKYGRTAFRELSYTPQKLTENFLYKEVTVTKKIEVEKKRIRQLESETTVQSEKIRQLETQIETVRKSLTLQIDMYKKMLKEKDEEHAKLIKSQQTTYNLEIHRLLEEHEQDSKVAQAEKEELEARIAELLRKIEELQYQLHHGSNAQDELTQNLEMTTQNLKNTQEKLSKTEELAKMNQDRANNQISSLNRQLQKQRASFKEQLQNVLNQKARELDGVKKLHQTELDKYEQKRASEMSAKNLELKQLAKTFESEGRRLDEIISHKDRVNSSLTTDLNKQKNNVVALTHQYETQISSLLQTKQMLLSDLDRISQERGHLASDCQTLERELGKTHNQSEIVISNLKGELSQKNADLLRENQRLMRTVQAYESELGYLKDQQMQIQHEKQVDTTRIRITSDQLAEENRHLLLEIKNLREVLMESSLEMERCKDEFLRLDREKQRLLRINHDAQADRMGMKALLAERDLETRQWRDTCVVLKSRY